MDATTDQTACTPLGELGVGTYATLRDHRLEAADADELRALGLRPECRLKVCKRGEPCIVSVDAGACRIAMTKTLAAKVLVQPE